MLIPCFVSGSPGLLRCLLVGFVGKRRTYSMVGRLIEIKGDHWTVQAQLLKCSCALLSVLSPRDAGVADIYALVEELLGGDAHPLVLQAGVVALSQCVGSQHSSMTSLFLRLAVQRSDVTDRLFSAFSDPLNITGLVTIKTYQHALAHANRHARAYSHSVPIGLSLVYIPWRSKITIWRRLPLVSSTAPAHSGSCKFE